MRLIDLAVLVQERLRALPYPGYLCSMCIAVSVTKSLYRESLSSREEVLVAEVVAVVKDSVRHGDGDFRGEASGLFEEIYRIIDDESFNKPPLVDSMLLMVCLLAGEISGDAEPYEAVEHLGNAISEYSGYVSNPEPQLVKVQVDADADEGSPGVQLLHKFEALADEINHRLSRGDLYLDSDAIQEIIFS